MFCLSLFLYGNLNHLLLHIFKKILKNLQLLRDLYVIYWCMLLVQYNMHMGWYKKLCYKIHYTKKYDDPECHHMENFTSLSTDTIGSIVLLFHNSYKTRSVSTQSYQLGHVYTTREVYNIWKTGMKIHDRKYNRKPDVFYLFVYLKAIGWVFILWYAAYALDLSQSLISILFWTDTAWTFVTVNLFSFIGRVWLTERCVLNAQFDVRECTPHYTCS